MRKLSVFSVVVLLVLTASVSSQTTRPDKQSDAKIDAVKLGRRKINLPMPDGFISPTLRFPKVADRLRAATTSASELLAAYVSDSLVSDEFAKLDLFATIQISRNGQSNDIQPEVSTAILGSIENARGGTLFDIDNPTITKALDQRLNLQSNSNVKVDIPSIEYLGLFDKRPNVVGEIFMRTDDFSENKNLVGAGSFVYISRRLIYVAVYKRLVHKRDVAVLRDVAKKWNDEIIEANK